MSLSSSSHFPLMLDSKLVKPVVLPPGCAKLYYLRLKYGTSVSAE